MFWIRPVEWNLEGYLYLARRLLSLTLSTTDWNQSSVMLGVCRSLQHLPKSDKRSLGKDAVEPLTIEKTR